MSKRSAGTKRLPGKRVEIFEVQGKLRPISVEIRLEKSGMFFALWAGERYQNTNVEELRNELRHLVRQHENANFTFKTYIEYRLSDDTHHPKYAKHEKREGAFIGLEFRVIELSDEIVGEGLPATKARLIRPAKVQLDIEAPQYPLSFVETRRYFPSKGTRVVPYTAERLRVLQEIQETLLKVRTRLHEFLDVPVDVAGDALDWLHVSRLFPRMIAARDVRPSP